MRRLNILTQNEELKNVECDSCRLFQEHFSKFGGVEKVKLMSDQVGSFQLPIQELRALYSLYRIV